MKCKIHGELEEKDTGKKIRRDRGNIIEYVCKKCRSINDKKIYLVKKNKKEFKERRSLYHKEWSIRNKDKLMRYKKEYTIKNKLAKRMSNKKYRDKNRININEKQKKHRDMCSENYISNLLVKHEKNLLIKDLPIELIDAKRIHIQIKRMLKERKCQSKQLKN